MSLLTPKNTQSMNDFCSSRFVNNNQRFCLRSCQSLRLHFFLFPFSFLIHSLPLNHQPTCLLTPRAIRLLPIIAAYCQPLPAFPQNKISGFFPLKNHQIIWQIRKKHPQNELKKPQKNMQLSRAKLSTLNSPNSQPFNSIPYLTQQVTPNTPPFPFARATRNC